MRDVRGKELSKEVCRVIYEAWPIHPSAVCRVLGMETTISNISKIKYHFDVLKRGEKIRTKKIDRALVGWPADIEKLRIIHDFMKDM